ncbi:hypothetical protein SEUCBS139899_005448 [Sporothrix eucalyptigena]|uniref:DUF7707 domain-containing protein n=1 Tax=Sporothrix eucalyptigena TaxID=1812306 RepID=A0ABP0CT12_9PEZI
MRSSVFVALSALGLVSATNFTIDISSVPLTTRSNWCTAQSNTCSTLCDNDPTANSCDPNTLDYSCLCQNGSAPGLQYYTQTMPTFICQEAYSECNAEYAGNAQAQANCTTSIEDQCGTLDPANYTAAAATTSSKTSAATGKSTGTASAATASGTAAVTTTSSKAGSMPTAMVGNGAAAVALGLFAYLL